MRRYLVMLLAVMVQLSFAQNFTPLKTDQIKPDTYIKKVSLDKTQFSKAIYSAKRNTDIVLAVPLISDTPVLLRAYPILSEKLLAQHPDLRVYRYDEGQNHGIITITEEYLFLSNNNVENPVMISPDFESLNTYIISSNEEQSMANNFHKCGTIIDQIHNEIEIADTRDLKSFGSQLRVYDLALVVTGEYYQANGNTNASVRQHAINSAANISDIFTKDLAVILNVVDVKLNSDPNTDNFTPSEERTQQAHDEIVAQYPIDSYDIGHVFHQHEDGGEWVNAGQTGGVAQTPAVCINQGEFKARGWSGAFENNSIGWIQLAAHEFGHMFGASHTFNGDGGTACFGSAIPSTSAYEIGSGTTIMSYNDLCEEEQNIPSSGAADSYFHVHSLLQMINHIENTDCASIDNSFNNNPPEIEINPCNQSYQIPHSTPFIMSAEGSDSDGDLVEYVWEQYDHDSSTTGEIGANASANTVGPLFRSFPPSTDISRSFPDKNTAINGNSSDPFQALPGRARLLNFKLTARDNKGGTVSDDRQVEVLSEGPFAVTSPNGNSTIDSGNQLEVTWTTGGANDVCNLVDIYLSIDGGYTSSMLLANDVSYSSQSTLVNIPSTISNTEKARIMIICDDNPCLQIFDFSNANFTIESGCRTQISYICDTEPLITEQGNPSLNLNASNVMGELTKSMEEIINTGISTMDITVNGVSPSPCAMVGNYFYKSRLITPTETGSYTFDVDRSADGGFGFISIFEEEGFNESNGCSSFIGSSGTQGLTGVGAGTSVSVELESCKKYVVAFINYGALPVVTRVTNISGPGEILNIVDEENLDYSYTYVAVNTESNSITSQSPTGDFTSLSGGNYEVYGVSYKSGGPVPPSNTDPDTWIGQSLDALLFSGNCLLQSQNFKSIIIESSCSIDGISNGSQSSCDPNTNTYSQDLIIEYSEAPLTGSLIVNGASFQLTGPPQGIILENLVSDGAPVDVTVSFSEDGSCENIFPAVFTAPENCCPITLDLGDDQTVCIDDILILDAGPDGATYEWTNNNVALADMGQFVTPTSTGVYRVTVTNADDCAKTDEVSLTIFSNPEILLNGNSSQCEGELATLNPNVGNADFTYSWTRDGDFVAGSEIIEVSIPGEYCILVTDSFSGCTSTACTTVEFIDAPDVDLGDDLTGCVGDELMLDAGTDGSSYRWFKDDVEIPNEILQTLTISENGTYIVIVSEGLCSTPDTIIANLSELPTVEFDISNSFTLCEGTSELATITGFFDDYTITRNGTSIATGTNPTYLIEEGGEYIITATNIAGCEARDTTTAIESPIPVVELGEDKIGCIGSEVILDAGMDGAEYIWFLGTDILAETDPVITVNVSGAYSVIVSNDVFCTATDMVMVDFLPGPSLDIGESFDLCEGMTETVVATTDGDNIKWYKDGVEIMGQTDFMLEVSESGVYLAEVEGTSGCAVEDQVTVNVFENPIVSIDPTRTICDGDMTTIIAGDATNNYLWTNSEGTTVSQTEELTTGTADVYTVFATNSDNCITTSQVEVIVTPFPMLNIDDTSVYCQGSSSMLTVDGAAESYSWERDGTAIPGETSSTIEVSEPGVYTVIGTNGNDCSISVFTTVTELANPTFDLGVDTDLCPGDNLMLTVSEAGTYEWSTTETDQTITIEYDDLTDTETTITAMLTTVDGCTAMDEIVITKLTNPTPMISEEETICIGDTIALTVTASDGSPTDDYQWSGPDGTFSSTTGSSIEVFPTEDAVYTVTVVNGCGVSMDMASSMVFIDQPDMDLSAGRDTCVVIGRSINLDATGGDSYEWVSDPSFVGAATESSPEVMPILETTYTVNITNDNGCTYTDSVTVCIIEDPFSLILPISLITPNGDGMNDFLEFKGLEAFPDNRLRIYNRWGVIVFDRESYQNGSVLFDGARSGDGLLPPDTYYYILEIDEKVVFKQNLTIVRN